MSCSSNVQHYDRPFSNTAPLRMYRRLFQDNTFRNMRHNKLSILVHPTNHSQNTKILNPSEEKHTLSFFVFGVAVVAELMPLLVVLTIGGFGGRRCSSHSKSISATRGRFRRVRARCAVCAPELSGRIGISVVTTSNTTRPWKF